jgi:CheY-like chemotaxis protein
VIDTGVGISGEDLNFIFDAFRQAESGRTASEGTGLGLTITRKFVELMGGCVEVSSQVGQGSVFVVQIPVQIEPPTMALPDVQQQVIGLLPDQPAYRILIVDDHSDNRTLLTKILGGLGFDVQEAQNGYEAIAQWQVWQPHLILLDVRMPEIDGYQTIHLIRQQEAQQACPSPVKIIVLTASAFDLQRAAEIDLGCDDFMIKPFQWPVLFEKLAEQLGVQYVYRDIQAEDSEASRLPQSSASLSDMLATMPSAWINTLYEAAICCNDDVITRLISAIPAEYGAIAPSLAYYAQEYQFERIMYLALPFYTGNP